MQKCRNKSGNSPRKESQVGRAHSATGDAQQPPNLERIYPSFAGRGAGVGELSHSRILNDTRLQNIGQIKWNEISRGRSRKRKTTKKKGTDEEMRSSMGKRKHPVIAAAETWVCYQRSRCLRQSGSGSCSLEAQGMCAPDTSQSPAWRKQFSPPARRPREQWEPRKKGELPASFSVWETPAASSLWGWRACKIQTIRISWGAAWDS